MVLVQATLQRSTKIRVFIADDHQIARQGTSLVIREQADMEVIGEANNGWEAVELIRKLNPELALMDIEMPGLSGIEAAKRLNEVAPDTSILIHSAYDREDLLVQALQAGASGYVLKATNAEDLLAAIRAVHSGQVCISPSMAPKLVRAYLKRLKKDEETDRFDKLGTREIEVMRLLAEGQSLHAIANELQISPLTVQTHRQRIMRKLGLHSGTELLKYALRKGIVRL